MLRPQVLTPRAPAERRALATPSRMEKASGARLEWARKLLRHQLAMPGAVGFLGSFLATIAATHPGGVFLVRSDPWFFRIPLFSGDSQYPSLIAFYFGVAMLVWAWLAVVRAARSPDGPSVGLVMVLMGIWALPLLVGPPLFSGDVFVYSADGQLVNHGLNPYGATPYALGPSPFRSAAHGVWLHTVSPYGPLFLRIAGAASTIGGHTVVGTVIAFRLFACAGLGLAAFSLTAISRRYGERPAHVLALIMLSPLTLLHLVSAGHNDAIMVGLLVAGVALATSGRPWVAIALCTLAATVKLPAGVAILFILWNLARDLPSVRAKLATAARGGVVALGTIVAVTAASGLSWGWLGTLGVPGTAIPRAAVVNDLAFGFDRYLGLSFPTALHLWRDLGMLVALAAVGYLLLRYRGKQTITALGVALLVVALLGPTFYPWYLTWGLMLVAATVADRWERAIVWASVVPVLLVAPGGAGWFDLLADKMAHTWVARSLVGAMVAVAALTAYRPGWIASLFRRAPLHVGSPTPRPDDASSVQLRPAVLVGPADAADDRELFPALVSFDPPPDSGENEAVY